MNFSFAKPNFPTPALPILQVLLLSNYTVLRIGNERRVFHRRLSIAEIRVLLLEMQQQELRENVN